ncbi:MAG TPA: hypothetical protein VFH56_08605, partial [Acidimicrobiales bacterium]|nr:hypothetical protein [Acidimicrobiales bacterium]
SGGLLMPLGSSTALQTAVTAYGGYASALSVSITLPGVGALTFGTANVTGVSFQESDTSSYPYDLANASGIEMVAGTVTLFGAVIVSGALVPVTRLFNPDDPASPIYRQQVGGSPVTVSLGAAGAPLVTRSGYVTTTEVDVEGGTVAVDWSDVPPGWSNLPAIEAVLIESPYNAGLTSEFVIDRIARTASGGAVSSWPAQRPNCLLAVGLRSSLWPEVGSLDTSVNPGQPTFTRGVFGSALSGATGTYDGPNYTLAQPFEGDVVIEYWVTGTGGVSFVSVDGPHTSLALQADFTGNTLQAQLINHDASTQDTFSVPLPDGAHYVAAHFDWTTFGVSWSVDLRLDGVTTSSGTRPFAHSAASLTAAVVQVDNGSDAAIEAVQVTTESAPAWNDTFTPKAVLDESLNVLQAVPGINAGADAYSELQSVAEAEGGWIGFRNGVLTFLNRQTIASQAPSRSVQASRSFVSLAQAQTGATVLFDDLTIDYTEYTWGSSQVVFTPVKAWKVPARSTQTWARTLANGVTVGEVDQTIQYLTTDTSTPGVNYSVMRASQDRNGVKEMSDPSKLSGSVRAVTPSRIEITVTNHSAQDVWLVSPSNYTPPPAAGTPSLWINGIEVTPDQPTIVHPPTAPANPTSVYQVPSNGYRQDHDSTCSYADDLLAQLNVPRVSYGSVDVVADPSITVPDRVTLDVPVAGGGVEPLDVLVWGVSFSASFDQGSVTWDMSLDVRAVAAPGQWVWDVSTWDGGDVWY